ncbi:MAG: zinc-ribbon domain-containing protein [Kofleriaceae bacterium]|nr:zinc-ribbon domain-containing protein [Kofleriaceae bacterium]
MDVRCPNCESEYELEEARLRPGGVTVKCANCEHVFRVRKRGDSALSQVKKPVAAVAAPASPPSTGEEEERSWLVRLSDGEIKVCRELATLQRWIVSGTVTPDCEISRTGKKWKPLRQLKELSSFFSIAQEAKDVASGKIAAPGGPNLAAQGTQVAQNPAPAPARRPHTISRGAPNESRPANEGYKDELTLQLAEQPFLENEQDTVEMSLPDAELALAASLAPSDLGDTMPSIQANLVRATMNKQAPPKQPPPKPKSKKATMLGAAIPAMPPKVPARSPSIPPPAPGSQAARMPAAPVPAAPVPAARVPAPPAPAPRAQPQLLRWSEIHPSR